MHDWVIRCNPFGDGALSALGRKIDLFRLIGNKYLAQVNREEQQSLPGSAPRHRNRKSEVSDRFRSWEELLDSIGGRRKT